jgi:NhaP-type Na+/H+ or K+/H+ antiporter
MHWSLAVISVTLLAFAAISGRLAGTPITPAMVFTGVGLLVGSEALGLVELAPAGETVKLLAEATLALVLFGDASRIDIRALRGELTVPLRLLGIGLPLTLLAGFVCALVVFPELMWAEALLLAVILAPTDAALGQAVVTLTRLPSRVRQGLNVESGLNDGICVPLFWIVLAIAQAESGAIGNGAAVRLVLEQIGYGIMAGVLAGIASAIVVVAGGRRHVAGSWLQVVPLAGAGLAFGIADPIGGSGFIAAFVGGFVFGAIRREAGGEVEYLLEELGDVLGAVTFIVFGAVLLGPVLGDVSWQVALYAVLSLTVVRLLPVGAAMIGTGARKPTLAFLGWFGPRGLASIVFAILVLEEGGLPHDDLILDATYVTIGLSVLAHGLTAAPLADRYASWYESHPRDALPRVESSEVREVRWRFGLGEGRSSRVREEG